MVGLCLDAHDCTGGWDAGGDRRAIRYGLLRCYRGLSEYGYMTIMFR